MPSLKASIIPVTPFQQNCLLLWDDSTKHGSVFDPGGDAGRIFEQIRDAGIAVDHILLTHGHLDHAGGAMELKRRLADAGQQVDIVGPDPCDRFLLDGIEAQAAKYQIEGMANCAPDRWLAEGDTVEAAGIAFEVLHCPGHTPGHVVFAARKMGLAIVGDVLFKGSVGRTDFPYGDAVALLRSIKEKLLPLGDATQFLCGHGPGSSIGVERRGNPFLASLRA
jgi:glyoxylase-like metal-dependent hydrolase (beta-lactamase superfamily II)